ncbi:MAG TPA: hypothetical protein VFL54_09995 [Gammaproteobacteria bacterium]|nr:hypothetical protein [Gammaproteobacteria bacterium]
MNLSPTRLNALLNKVGQDVAWRAGYDCPCRNPRSGAADPGCANCHGLGVTWRVDATAARTALAAQKIQRQWADFGLWQNGDVVLSIPSDSPLYDIGEFDRVVFSQSSEPFSHTRIHDGTDRLAFPVVTVSRVFWLANDAIVEGGIPDVDAADGVLTWAGGEPPPGMQYSITGRRRPEYFCFGDFPQDRAHQGGARLPRRVVLRKFDLFGRSG